MAQNYLKGVKHEFIKPVSESKFSGEGQRQEQML